MKKRYSASSTSDADYPKSINRDRIPVVMIEKSPIIKPPAVLYDHVFSPFKRSTAEETYEGAFESDVTDELIIFEDQHLDLKCRVFAKFPDPELVMICFHGYGGNMHCLGGIATEWYNKNRGVKANWVFVQGGHPVRDNEHEATWFPLENRSTPLRWSKVFIQHNRENKTYSSLKFAYDCVLDICRSWRIPSSRTGLIGYSQGAMVVLDIALQHPGSFGFIGLINGSGIGLRAWKRKLKTSPRLPSPCFYFQTHSKIDCVIPYPMGKYLWSFSKEYFPCTSSVFWPHGDGHDIRMTTVSALCSSIEGFFTSLLVPPIKGTKMCVTLQNVSKKINLKGLKLFYNGNYYHYSNVDTVKKTHNKFLIKKRRKKTQEQDCISLKLQNLPQTLPTIEIFLTSYTRPIAVLNLDIDDAYKSALCNYSENDGKKKKKVIIDNGSAHILVKGKEKLVMVKEKGPINHLSYDMRLIVQDIKTTPKTKVNRNICGKRSMIC